VRRSRQIRQPRLSRILTLEELSLGQANMRTSSRKEPHRRTHVRSEE